MHSQSYSISDSHVIVNLRIQVFVMAFDKGINLFGLASSPKLYLFSCVAIVYFFDAFLDCPFDWLVVAYVEVGEVGFFLQFVIKAAVESIEDFALAQA